MDALSTEGRKRSHRQDSPAPLPVDYAGEAGALIRAFPTDVLDDVRPPWLRRVLAAPVDTWHHPAHRDLVEAARALYANGVDPTRGRVLDELVVRTGRPLADWRRELNELAGRYDTSYELFVSTDTVDDVFEHLERFRRQRWMIGQAGRLADQALAGTDWHETINELAALGRTNGAVFSASTLEVIDFDAIVRGDAPEVEAFWLRRRDGRPLLYPGRIHDLHAEPSVGKTWIACEAVRQVFDGGGNVCYLDYEDVGAAIFGRLMALGVDPQLLTNAAGRWRYINPIGALDALELGDLHAILDELNPDLVVLDGVAEALARDGADETSNTDVTLWAERVVRPIARRGAAVLMLDHVPKNIDSRARGARGAGAKLALIDGASFEVRLAVSFSRRKAGLLKLVVAKDRPGMVGAIGEVAAEARIEPYLDGDRVEVVLDEPAPIDETFRPTGIMQALSERLENAAQPLTAELLLKSIRRGKRAIREEALAVLVAEGFAEEVHDPNTKTVAYRSLAKFREVDDAIRRRGGPTTTPARAEFRAEPTPIPNEPPPLFDHDDGTF